MQHLSDEIVHRALANNVRREILLSLAGKEKYLSEIAEEIKKKPQTIDFHLNLLQEIGLIQSNVKNGKKYYVLTEKKVLDFLRHHDPVPAEFRPKPPHEIVLDMWKDMETKLDRIEKKLDKLTQRK